jgi:hypothetical protein
MNAPAQYRSIRYSPLAIGLGYWTTIFNIEQKTARFRLLTGLVAIGGLCRLFGMAMGDGVSLSTAGPLVLELGLAPVLCFWQNGGPCCPSRRMLETGTTEIAFPFSCAPRRAGAEILICSLLNGRGHRCAVRLAINTGG